MSEDYSVPMIGRPHTAKRFGSVIPGIIVTVISVALLVKGTWGFGLLLLPLGLYGVTELRRKVTVTADRLIAQGRLTRKEVALADLTQVALSPMVQIWVSTTAGESFYLRMIAPFEDITNPGVREFYRRLRLIASDAGAELGPDPGESANAPKGTAPVFSF